MKTFQHKNYTNKVKDLPLTILPSLNDIYIWQCKPNNISYRLDVS